MEVQTLAIPGPKLIMPDVFGDDRGYFFESFSGAKYQAVGIPVDRFVQDNVSRSKKGVVRGLHYQAPPFEQGKLVQVLSGRVLDVALDIRVGSPTYGQHVMAELSEENHQQFWIPAGFAHGFLALEDETVFLYKVTNPYDKASDRGVLWNDPALEIEWLEIGMPLVSEKDAALPRLSDLTSEFSYGPY